MGPPLRAIQKDGSVVLDLQRLGEYPSPVGRIRLSRVDPQQVVWELRAGSRTPKVSKLRLRVGENPTLPPEIEGLDYSVITPGSRRTFWLQPGTEYSVEVWGTSQLLKSRTSFIMTDG